MHINVTDISCSTKQILGVDDFLRRVSGGWVEDHCTKDTFREFIIHYIAGELNRRGDEARTSGHVGFIFSDVCYIDKDRRRSGGQKLASYITSSGLGTIRRSPRFKNYNTQNYVRVWFFLPSDELMAECR
jgi:hypothetical protein